MCGKEAAETRLVTGRRFLAVFPTASNTASNTALQDDVTPARSGVLGDKHCLEGEMESHGNPIMRSTAGMRNTLHIKTSTSKLSQWSEWLPQVSATCLATGGDAGIAASITRVLSRRKKEEGKKGPKMQGP